MSKEKFLTVSVVFLLVLNLGTLGYLFFSRPPQPPELWKIVVERVGFNEQQTEQYLLLRDAHRKGMDLLDEKFASTLQRYLSQIKEAPDSAKESWLSNELAELEKRKAKHTLIHFRNVRALCKPEQLPKFDELVPELMRVMLPPKNPHPPRRKP